MSPEKRIQFFIDQKVSARDGTKLSVDVILPQGSGQFPTLLSRNPYESNSQRHLERAYWWAKNGYAFVSGDCRGRYESEGLFYPQLPDGSDGYDTLAWIACQPWSNGKIGTVGPSYSGGVQWKTAPLGSPHLSAMAAHVYGENRFRDLHYLGGAFQLALSLMAALTFETNLATASFGGVFDQGRLFRHLPLIDLDVQLIGKKISWWRDWLEHPVYDQFWSELDSTKKYKEIDVPVFMRCGWFDAFPSGMFRLWQGLKTHGKTKRSRQYPRLLMGPWSHQEPISSRLGDLEFGSNSYLNLIEEEKRWFDFWLCDIENGISDEPPLKLFLMGANEWRLENEWPLKRTLFTPFFFHSGGQANSLNGDGLLSTEKPGNEKTDHFTYDPNDPVPSIGGNLSTSSWSWTISAEEPLVPGPVDQRVIEKRDDILVYTTEELQLDLEVTGPVVVILFAASSAPDTDFTAKLIDVYPHSASIVMAEGIIRARYREGFLKTELIQPNTIYQYKIELYPTSNLFKKGHRIRVDISSSNFPRFSRNLNTGEDVATGTRMQSANQTIYHDHLHPSHIILPIIPVKNKKI